MKQKLTWGLVLAGFAAGAVNGLFGAGGGMILIPIMGLFINPKDHTIFSASVAVILPICLISLIYPALSGTIPWEDAIEWIPGSAMGGYLAVKFGKKIPVLWLHRGLGLLILYGGVRYLC